MADEKTVDSWMEELDPSLREVAQTLRGLILQSVPDISESIKWGHAQLRQERSRLLPGGQQGAHQPGVLQRRRP